MNLVTYFKMKSVCLSSKAVADLRGAPYILQYIYIYIYIYIKQMLVALNHIVGGTA